MRLAESLAGATKPTYDIWGDTVNVASRLESSGVAGRIQVSERVAAILAKRDQFELECRGPIEVKGKGVLTTYLVVTPFDCSDSDLLQPEAGADGSKSARDDAEQPSPPPALEDEDDAAEVEELCNSNEQL